MTTPDVVMRGLICCKFGGMCDECPYNLDDEQNEIDIEDCTKAMAEDVYDYIKQLVTNTPRWISVKKRAAPKRQRTDAETGTREAVNHEQGDADRESGG